jgi:hypothetical protein
VTDKGPFVCGTGDGFFPLYPKASLLFTVYPNSEKFRVATFVYTKKDPTAKVISIYSEPVVMPTELGKEVRAFPHRTN